MLCCYISRSYFLDGQIVSICTLTADSADFIRGCCSRERFAIFAENSRIRLLLTNESQD